MCYLKFHTKALATAWVVSWGKIINVSLTLKNAVCEIKHWLALFSHPTLLG